MASTTPAGAPSIATTSGTSAPHASQPSPVESATVVSTPARSAAAARRPAWWLPIVLVPVLAIFAVCLANARAWIGRPFSGLLFLENGIVVSIGRAQWTHARYRNVPFSRILAVDGHPVAGGAEIHARVAARGIGATVTYTLRKGTEITRLRLPVRPFARADFLELFFPLLGVGFLMVVVGAAVVARLPRAPHAHALFALCLAIGLYLITGPD